MRLHQVDDPLAAFALISSELGAQHPATPMAWRVFDADTGATLAEHGQRLLLVDSGSVTMPMDRTVDVGRGRHARAFATPSGLRVLLVVDGTPLLAFLGTYWLVAGVLIAISSTVALLASRLLARRVAGLVRAVADDVRAARVEQGEPTPRRTAPDEIRGVVEGLRLEMRHIREETERVRTFTAGLAHELRSPLQNLIGQAEVALLRPREGAEYQAVLASQVEELAELSYAVDNLLTICAPARAAIGAATEDFDLAAEAALRLQRERTRAAREGIELQVRSHGDTRMAGDREGVLRGIRNVVANAIDWTPRNGRVLVSIDGEDGQLRVTVDDTGPGVPAEDRQRIFKPFAQGAARRRKRIGYGLGLAIAQSAVDNHGGDIAAETSPLGGARFRMTFRRAKKPAIA